MAQGGEPGERSWGRVFDDAAYGLRGLGVTWVDAAVAVGALALAGVCWLGLYLGWGGNAGGGASSAPVGGPYAVVQNTEGYRVELPLAQNATVSVQSPLGTNVIEIADGKVRCLEADCGNQVCVDTGWVSGEGQMIVCLPHEMTVQVVDDPADAIPLG